MKLIYKLHKKIWFELTGKVIRLRPKASTVGSVLISYTTLPFLLKDSLLDYHTNRFECKQIANSFLLKNYEVDIIDWTNKDFIPKKSYDFFIDIHNNLERLSPLLNPDCKKILHLTTSFWSFQNNAEINRLLDLEKRRGVKLLPRRQLTPANGVTIADFITLLGNKATEETYKQFNKKIYQIPLSTTHTFPFPEGKNYKRAKNKFIWMGGAGMVHKGLDLVLDAFKEMPECELSIFGNVKGESDFNSFFHKELYELPNITCFGKVDPGSKLFQDKANESIALIYPSCSEGQSGSVITCLHAALIPIVSKESGVDCPNFGLILADSTVESIKDSIKDLMKKDEVALKEESLRAWQYARSHHTKEAFAKSYMNFIDIITNKN